MIPLCGYSPTAGVLERIYCDKQCITVNYKLIQLEIWKHLMSVIGAIVNLYHLRQIAAALLEQLTMLLDLLESKKIVLFFIIRCCTIYCTAGTIFTSLYFKLFYMTCVAYLLHSCAIKVKSHFEDVDQLIANVKSPTSKNKTRQAKFAAIGFPPQPVVTRIYLN